jgi:hypothetical protein
MLLLSLLVILLLLLSELLFTSSSSSFSASLWWKALPFHHALAIETIVYGFLIIFLLETKAPQWRSVNGRRRGSRRDNVEILFNDVSASQLLAEWWGRELTPPFRFYSSNSHFFE